MPTPRFLQIHSLVSYPAVLLNRDDSGLAKRISYGGKVRTRISSQCLKRHWRTAEDEWSLAGTGFELSVRTREVFEFEIGPKVTAALPEVTPAVVDAVGAALSRALYGEKADDVRKRQALLLGWPEVRHLTEVAIELTRGATDEASAKVAAEAYFKNRDVKANLSAIRDIAGSLASGLEAALFGRMVTSDPAANTDAAIHVAHAFTVHAEETETDYFTVVDDLKARDENEDSGSAGIFDTELTSGLFYGYVVVDVPLLVSNLTGRAPDVWNAADTERAIAAKVVEHLLHLVATVSPGAKKGSTAPYAFARTVLVEAGPRQPRSLASAFEKPLRATAEAGIGEAADAALFETLRKFDAAYGMREARRHLAVDPAARDGLDAPLPLDALAAWTAGAVAAAEA